MTTGTAPHRAFVLTSEGEISLTRPDMPQAGRSHVLVRVTAAGVCGTDLTDYRQRLAAPGTLPAVPLGHEVAGTVADAGESGWAVGTPVVVDPAFFCGACHHCEAGRTSYCTELKLLGHNYGSGGLTDHLAVPADALVEIPPGIDPVAAALIEPLSCAHHAARKAGDESSEAVIVGAGAIGVGIALVLRAQGFERLVLLDPVAERRAAATALGLDARAEPPSAPAALVFEASGVEGGFQDACRLVSRGGHLVVAAQHAHPLTLDSWLAFGKELRLSWSLGALREDFRAVIALVRTGRLRPEGMATGIRPEDFSTHTLEAMAAGKHPKAVLRMGPATSGGPSPR
ncbi:alcohol dehydrogenase catalytic domain-containing protein [Streptomyces sp. NBC_00247]|uniref:zinc-dependent alcohol dehydrogenase n=1 Tax=Streptomyces sp. NBC_00247 TaxID=2975689 RepID=UPI002E298D30|nr:alcohol dehydrogenase catalytic domain-containing protein [Streptomyces sp. NBC_00247]